MLRAIYRLARAIYLITVIPLFLLVAVSFVTGGYSTLGDFLMASLLVSPLAWWLYKGYRSAEPT